jgi:hypothetical protein
MTFGEESMDAIGCDDTMDFLRIAPVVRIVQYF